MSLFDEILDENRPPPTYDYPGTDGTEEDDDDNNSCDERTAWSGGLDKGIKSYGGEVVGLSASALVARGNSLNDKKEEEEEELRLNDDLRTRLTQRSDTSTIQSIACPSSTSRPSSREGRPTSAASSDDGGSRPKSNASASSDKAPSLSKQVQRLAKLGVELNKAPKLGGGSGVVDLLLPDEVSEKSQKNSALDRWFKSKFEPRAKKTDSAQPAPVTCSANMAVKDASGATVLEKKVIVLNQLRRQQRQPMRGVVGHKIVKGELEAALARKRQAGLQKRKEWYEEDNPKSDAEESEAELTDGEESEGEREDGRTSALSDGGDDRASAGNELVDDEAVEDKDEDENEDDDDDVQEAAVEVAKKPAASRSESTPSVGAGTQPFCLRLDSEPDTLEINNDHSVVDDSSAEQSTIVDDDDGKSDVSMNNFVKKQISTADFFDDDDDGDVIPEAIEKRTPIQPKFRRPPSPSSARDDASKQRSSSVAQPATEFPMFGCSTPARPSHSKQSNGMFVASHDADNADTQTFMSVDLHLPESLSQWAADTSNDASLVSNHAGDVTNEEATTTDAENAPNELLALCSGKFSAPGLPAVTASSSTARTNSVESELLRLCSGIFPDDETTQHSSSAITDPIVEVPKKVADANDEIDNLSDASDDKTIEGYESNKSESSLSSTSRRKKVLVKRRRKRAVMSDSEDEGDDDVESPANEEKKAASYAGSDFAEVQAEEAGSGEEEEEDEEEEGEDEGEGEDEAADDDARNSSDDEVAVFRRLQQEKDKQVSLFDKHKKLRRDFYDEEAELSGSDVGSGDEDLGSDQDVYEAEEGDKDELPDEEELRQQVNRAFLKQQHDEDKRNVLLYQEALLPDGDLHDDGDRNRRFRWRQREGEDALNFALDDEMEPVGEQVDVDLAPEDTDAGRIQLIKWRASQDDGGNNSDDDAEADSQLLKMGQIAIQRQISLPSVDVSVAVTSSKTIVGGTSFLKRDATTLSLLTKGSVQAAPTNAKTTANSLFSAIPHETTAAPVKRSATDSDQSKHSLPVKRLKSTASDSIFRHFVN